MDVAFEMIHCDQGFVEAIGQGFGVTDSYEQRSGEAWALRDGNRVQRLVSLMGLC
jgi:hypothetical protein